MGSSRDSHSELRRQAALYSLAVLDTEPEEEFDRIARLAQRLLDVASALVSFMDHDRQWYKARVGVDTTQAARSETFCTHVIESGAPLVVSDASDDPRFAANPHVVAVGGVRFQRRRAHRAPEPSGLHAGCRTSPAAGRSRQRRDDLEMTLDELLARADAAMYERKSRRS